MSTENEPRLVGAALDLPGAPLTVFVKANFDPVKQTCPKCGMEGYRADIVQMGACKTCAEKILGEPIMVLREWAHMLDEPDDAECPGQRKGLRCE